jgi:hypothetical protein
MANWTLSGIRAAWSAKAICSARPFQDKLSMTS